MINITQEEIIKEWACDDLDSPLVSIRCPTYNHEKFITQALDGFLMQKTTFPFEVVTNHLREDVVEQPLAKEEALQNSHNVEDGQITLPKVVRK